MARQTNCQEQPHQQEVGVAPLSFVSVHTVAYSHTPTALLFIHRHVGVAGAVAKSKSSARIDRKAPALILHHLVLLRAAPIFLLLFLRLILLTMLEYGPMSSRQWEHCFLPGSIESRQIDSLPAKRNSRNPSGSSLAINYAISVSQASMAASLPESH